MSNRREDTGPYSPPSQPGACCSQVGVFRISIVRQSRLTSSCRCASGVRAGMRPFGGIDDERRARTGRLRRAEDRVVGPGHVLGAPARTADIAPRVEPARVIARGTFFRGREFPIAQLGRPLEGSVPHVEARSPRDPDVPIRSCRSPAPPPGRRASWKTITTAASAIATRIESSSRRCMSRPPRMPLGSPRTRRGPCGKFDPTIIVRGSGWTTAFSLRGAACPRRAIAWRYTRSTHAGGCRPGGRESRRTSRSWGYDDANRITPDILSRVAEIAEAVGRAEAAGLSQDLRLRRINRIRTIQGSLAIEGNVFSEEQIATTSGTRPARATCWPPSPTCRSRASSVPARASTTRPSGGARRPARARLSSPYMLEVILAAVRTPPGTPAGHPPSRAPALLSVLDGEMSLREILHALGLCDRKSLRQGYLVHALQGGYVEMTRPDAPSARNQKYRLTPLGQRVRSEVD